MNCKQNPARSARQGLLGLLMAAGLVAAAAAQGIVVDDVQDKSDSQPDVDAPFRKLQFDHRLQVQPPSLTGDHAELDLRYQWSFGHWTSSTAPAERSRNIGWSLAITVQDPDRRGFELSVHNRLKGVVGSILWTGFDAAVLPDLEVWMYEMFAPTPRRLSGVSTTGTAAHFSDLKLVDQSRREEVGRYRGTQSFLFHIGPVAATLEASAIPGHDAWSWLQFGRRNGDPDMAFMNSLPSSWALDDLGQHFGIRVDYAPLPVPEPTTLALMAAGLLMLRMRRGSLA